MNEVFEEEGSIDLLENLLKTENQVRSFIVETNQSLRQFLRRKRGSMKRISTEGSLHDIVVTRKNEKHHVYVDDSDNRLWVIHHGKMNEKMQRFIFNAFSNSRLQDKIYLSHHEMSELLKMNAMHCNAVRIGFDQFFSKASPDPSLDDMTFELHLHAKSWQLIVNAIGQLNSVKLPINLLSMNIELENEDGSMITDVLSHDGSLVMQGEGNVRQHLDLVERIKSRYREKIKTIEDWEVDWIDASGGLFALKFDVEVDPIKFVDVLNERKAEFKIFAFQMYEENDSMMYVAIDLHFGDQFYFQAFPQKMILNLSRKCCGNTILRLLVNLQRHFSRSTILEIDDEEMKI